MLQRVGFPVAGLEVDGVLHIPDGEIVGGAVVLHGAGGTSEHSTLICAALAAGGVAALRFTFRDVDDPAVGLADTAAAIRLLRAHPQVPQRVGVVGYSYGGIVAALTAGRDSRIKAAALIATPGDLPLHGNWKPIAELSRTRAKVLLVRAGDDGTVSTKEADRYAAVLTQARVAHRVVTIEHADHEFGRPGTSEQMLAAVTGWMKEGLS